MSASGKKERERPPPPPLQLCVLDTRRGQQEGQEADKVLAFYPETVPADDRAAVVGLFLATNAFCSIFSQVQFRFPWHAHPSSFAPAGLLKGTDAQPTSMACPV